MIVAGKHRARPLEADLGRAKTGSNQVAIAFEILEGPDVGATITAYGYFTELTHARTVRTLYLCGWDGKDIADLSGIGRAAVEVELVIVHEPDQNGGTRATVRWVNPPGGGVRLGQRMTEAERTAFAARFTSGATRSPARPDDERSTSHRDTGDKQEGGTDDEPNGASDSGDDAPPF
jgi:hypothetical protein